jgi:hypothetical protein
MPLAIRLASPEFNAQPSQSHALFNNDQPIIRPDQDYNEPVLLHIGQVEISLHPLQIEIPKP